MKLKGDRKKILVPLRGKDKSGQQEFVEDIFSIEEIYRTTMENDHELTEEGDISLPSLTSLTNSDYRIYEWKM